MLRLWLRLAVGWFAPVQALHRGSVSGVQGPELDGITIEEVHEEDFETNRKVNW